MEPIDLLQIGKWSQIEPKIERYIAIDPNQPKYKNKIVIVSGVLGQGKTYAFESLNDTGGIITVIPRRSVLKEFTIRTNQIDWTWYEKDYYEPTSGSISVYEMVNAKNLAICNLSLYKLQTGGVEGRWNTAIFDEFSLTMATNVIKDADNTKATRKKDIRAVQDYLIENTETVWILGWLFDDFLIDYLESFSREILWEKYHWPILEDTKFELCDSEKQLLGSTAIDIQNGGGALIVSEKSNSVSKIYTNFLEKHIPHITPKICNADNRLTEEEIKQYNNQNTNANERLHITSPVNSVGTDYQEPNWETTTLHFTKQTPKLSGTDIVQFSLRNRQVKTFKWFPVGDEKNLEAFSDFTLSEVHFSQRDLEDFGTWNPDSGRRMIETDNPVAITQKYYDKKKAYEKKYRLEVAWEQFYMLGLRDENIYICPHEDLSEFTWTGNDQYIDEILSSQYLELGQYLISQDIRAKKYTDICNAFKVKTADRRHYYRYNNGSYQANKLRKKQMFDDYVVRDIKSGGSIENRKWNGYQNWIKKFIVDKVDKKITQFEFENSWVWQQLLKNKIEVNAVMEYQQLSDLRITVDDKVKPLHWLKRYLVKHDFNCYLEKPDKSKLLEIRKLARAENKKEFKIWRSEQKELLKDGQSFRRLKNFQIDHFLEYILLNPWDGRYVPLSDSLSQLMLLKGEYILTVKDFDF
jgi:hypothetical protein